MASEDVGGGGRGTAASKRKPGQEEEEERLQRPRLQSRPFLSVQFGARSREELVRETGEGEEEDGGELEFWPTQRKRLKVGL